MAKVLPGGSGASRAFPAALVGGGGGDLKWVEAYSLDLRAQSAHDFTSTATLAMGGVTWTAYNNAGPNFQTDGFKLDGSAGLRIWPDATNRIYTTRVDCGILGALVKDLVGVKKTYAMNAQAVCIQAYATAATDLNANYDSWGLICWNKAIGNPATNPRYILARGIYESSAKSQIVGYTENAGSTATWMDFEVGTAAQADRDFFQITIWPGPNYIASLYGAIGNMPASGDFPDPNDFTPSIGASVILCDQTNDDPAFALSNLSVGMMAQDEGAATDVDPIFSKIRVLYMDVV
jgi:hypothetical protein